MIKKFLTVLLAASLLASVAACSKKDEKVKDVVSEKVEGSSSNADDGEIDYTSDLSTERFDGYNFRILIRKTHLADQYLEEDSEDIVESATYRRNKLIEEMYGITITGSESSDHNYDTSALNSILAGDDAYDIIFTHSRAAFSYAVQGACVNFNEVESIHLDKPWWTRAITDSCSINGYLYVLDGDISSESLGATMCMLFNKRIFDELGYDYPYELVKDDEWTFDEFAYLAKKGGADLNGDGVIAAKDDRFGYISSQWQAPMNILYTGGQKIYDKNDEGVLELTLYSNKTVDIYDEYFSLIDNEACLLGTESKPHGGGEVFKEGRAMFTDSELRMAELHRDMDDDFGIIPYPKFDEDDVYATAANGGTHLMIMPITVSDIERTGAITEALCAIGSRDVIPAFYEQSLKTKYARDDASEEMIDLIRASRVFDLGYVAGGTFQSCGKDLANSESHDFASYYAKGENAALAKLADFNKDYGKIE